MMHVRRSDSVSLLIRRRWFLGGTALAVLLAGCAVGPDFKKPAAPKVSGYTQEPLAPATVSADTTGGETQHFTVGGDIAADWWTLFHSKPLSDLIEQAITDNPDLKSAQAALRAARETTSAQRGAYLPSLSADLAASRQSQSVEISPVPNTQTFQYNLFTPQLSLTYAPDVFGLNQRTVENLKAQQDAARYQMLATYTTLTSNVVVTAIQEASTRKQIEATKEIIDAEAKLVDILEYQLKKGYASGLDLAAQKSQLAQARASLPPLIKQEAQLHDQLSDLVGKFPSEGPRDTFELADLQLPQDIPVSLPSKLVRQRPDVLQAEANLHAASAAIGIAIANRLPNLQLTAGAGSEALAVGQLFTPGTNFWAIGADLTTPIFEGGTLLHRERAARAQYEQAAQQYRSTVLTAFQNVADTLTALQQDADALKAAAEAADAAKVTLDLTERQLKDGYASYLALLNAEQAYQQTRATLILAQANRYADTAALFQALGGGWWHSTEFAEDGHGK